MKKNIVFAFLLLAMLVFMGVSCKSAPSPEETPPEFSGITPVSQNAANDAKARADEARKRAIDFECPAYFPTDWEVTDARYGAASILPKSTAEEVQRAAALFNTVADEFDGLVKKTVQLYAQAREDELMAVRDELIYSGFTSIFPEYLEKADEIALTALDQYEAGDYYAARNSAVAAINEYKTLLVGARVNLIRQEVIDRGFNVYDPGNFDKADDIAVIALDKYEAGDKKAAEASAEEAGLRYSMILSNSWTNYAGDRRKTASSERERALSNKVNIAVRDIYRDAEAIFSQAEETLGEERYEDAAILFTEAEALFAVAGQETEDKRQRALGIIKMATDKIGESDGAALEAEKIIEGDLR
ncbi:MAG: hypothetical protein LBH44_03350 [Treponema sp.]|jgi:hypothetical protein|nr:hypothetical protein [Treponema sp.]